MAYHLKREGRKGQTIVEAMVAIGVLTTGFLGISALLVRSFFLNRVAADGLTATYLAAEGIELAKNIIDHDVYARLATPPRGAGWGTSFGPAGGNFQLDYDTCTTAGNCNPPADGNTPLRLDASSKRYSYSGPNRTKFIRHIRVTVPNANEIVVHSIVDWSTGAFTSQSVDLEDHFYNWH